jgi:hypothetical protein
MSPRKRGRIRSTRRTVAGSTARAALARGAVAALGPAADARFVMAVSGGWIG